MLVEARAAVRGEGSRGVCGGQREARGGPERRAGLAFRASAWTSESDCLVKPR